MVTKAQMRMWGQFTWEMVGAKCRLDTPLREIPIEGWKSHFSNGHTVQDLFTLGRPWLRPHVRAMALGSLMHTIQDSFALGHVDRDEPIYGQTCMDGRQPMFGRIQEFHSYAMQDHAKHKESDSSDGARKHVQLNDPDVIDAGKQVRQLFDAQADWPQVERFLSECLLVLKDRKAAGTLGGQLLAGLKVRTAVSLKIDRPAETGWMKFCTRSFALYNRAEKEKVHDNGFSSIDRAWYD